MTLMKTNDIFSLYVSYVSVNGGKRRPVYFLKVEDEFVYGLRITTKYAQKSHYIKQRYFEIKEWKLAGLNKKSWIDVGEVLKFSTKDINSKRIGYLCNSDKMLLTKFMSKLNSR